MELCTRAFVRIKTVQAVSRILDLERDHGLGGGRTTVTTRPPNSSVVDLGPYALMYLIKPHSIRMITGTMESSRRHIRPQSGFEPEAPISPQLKSQAKQRPWSRGREDIE
jgi:hypothetical protein